MAVIFKKMEAVLEIFVSLLCHCLCLLSTFLHISFILKNVKKPPVTRFHVLTELECG